LSNTSAKEKPIRVFELAKELNLESKTLIDYCQELGFAEVKNQLKGLTPEQADALKDRAKKGPKTSAAPITTKPVSMPPPGKIEQKITTLPKATKKANDAPAVDSEPATDVAHAASDHTTPAPVAHVPVVEPTLPPVSVAVAPTIVPPVVVPPVAPPASPSKLPTLTGGKIQTLSKPPAPKPTPKPSAIAPTAQPLAAVVPPPTPLPPPPVPKPTVIQATQEPILAPVSPPSPSKPVEPVAETPAPQPMLPVPPPAAPPTPVVPPKIAGPMPNLNRGSTGMPNLGNRTPPNPGPPRSVTTTGGPAPSRPSGMAPGHQGQRPPQGGGPGQGQGHGQGSGQGSGQGQRPPAQQMGGQRPPMGGGGGQQGQRPPQGGGGGQGGGGQGQRPGGPGGPGQQQGGPPRTGKGPPQVGPPKGQNQVRNLTPEMIEKIRKLSQQGQKANITEIQKTGEVGPTGQQPGRGGPGGDRGGDRSRRPGDDAARPGGPAAPGTGTAAPLGDRGGRGRGPTPDEEEEARKKNAGSGVIGRDARHKARQRGRSDSSTDRNAVVIGAGGSVEIIEEQHGSRKGPRQALLNKLRRRQQQVIIKKEGPIEISPPITVRSLSEAIGMKAGELILRLKKETNKLFAINSAVEFDAAELIAVEKGITLVLKKQMSLYEKVVTKYKDLAEQMDPALAVARAPIVTIMGHVDHGKTSLLDKIRQQYGFTSDVVSTEAGGITQVIRAWQVEKDSNYTTFLDTPGHEAFTKMRARGAKVTDIAVIVVAATDGVMPQTEEAINHARAAEVDIIIAINKIDMPNANLDKTRRQLYALNLLPDDMGGEVPFIETSAMTGQGIGELLDNIQILAELGELKADPEHPGSGTCLEAYQDADEGVKATLIVQQGTLHKGDIIICGSAYGRVRAMYNDMGVLIDEAGPSTPVKITGLDEVPDADDPFFVVDDLAEAREIAEASKSAKQRAALASFTPINLETFGAAKAALKITELKVILKAEARGSVEAIRKELEKLIHEEVRCRVLSAGIGAISESDVTLALTSPLDTLVIGFNVTADDAALRLAEQRGISIREYDIIYKLTDDVKAALEGKLKPIEEVVHLGRAVIRDTFKISKVGTIAGCYVTSGVIERSARVRVIRQGVVIFPPSEKVVGLDSLKRFKDDAKDVREGFECGLKISGFDDVKVDDVIEAFKIEVKQRTL
jgi:translation initiation factor IF-2